MPDYYAILSRALSKGDAADPRWRADVFGRTRRLLQDQLRAQVPPLTTTQIKVQTAALDAAIKTLESEYAPGRRPRTPSGGASQDALRPISQGEVAEERIRIPDAAARGVPLPSNRVLWIAGAVVVAAVAAGGYAFEATRTSAPDKAIAAAGNPANSRAAPAAGQNTRTAVQTGAQTGVPGNVQSGTPASTQANTPVNTQAVATANEPAPATANKTAAPPSLPSSPPPGRRGAGASDGDLPPGVDGGSTDADLPFFFRRQPVFYRTTHPVGTIIIDKQQHFLYLVQPNSVALRYGIGLGKACADVAGLRRVSSKVEWPQWDPPADMVERKLVPPTALPGGPGNPLGARLLGLDDGSSRIHGTNAPKTIGSLVNSGCIRLVNDEAVDLFNRVSMGARVVVSD
jgi:lipoprotein-anchoring transpeptidase ErfK/SrfK